MKTKQTMGIIFVIVVTMLFGVVFKYNDIKKKNENRQKILINLSNIHADDGLINQYFLSKYDRADNDEIQAALREFREHINKFTNYLKTEDRNNEEIKKIQKLFQEIKNRSQKREEILQRFISAKSIIINSMLYLPSLFVKIKQELSNAKISNKLKTDISNKTALSLSFIFYQLFEESLKDEEFNKKIKTLENIHIKNKELSTYLRFFILHMKNIYIQKQKIFNLINEKNKVDAHSMIDKLVLSYTLFYDNEFKFQNKLNLILFILLSIAIIILAYIFMLELKYKNELSKLNKELKIKIEEEVAKRQEKEKIIQNQKKISAMGELIVSISHHWRQPITAISVIVQDLVDAYKFNELDEKYLDDATQKIIKTVEDLSRTISNFDNMFVINKNKESVNLIKTLQDIQDFLKPEIENIEFSLHYDKDTSYIIQGYSSEIRQIFLNIIKNAIDAINEKAQNDHHFKGTIDIKVTKQNHNIKLLFKDNGIGVPKNIEDRIFEPYFSTKEQGKGEGLGLYMIKIMIESYMQGSISYKKINNWTVFELTFGVK